MKHDIKTLEDILKVVTPENIDNFLTDFRGFLTLNMLVDSTQKIFGEENIFRKDHNIFHWIDDGKTDAHINIEVIK